MLDKNGIGDCESGSCGNTFDTNPTGVASIGTIAHRLKGAVPVKEILKASGKYSGACLSGMFLGSYAGPDGAVAGCMITVAISALQNSSNPNARKAGTIWNLFDTGVAVLQMRNILLNPAKGEALIKEWKTLLREVSRR